MPGRRLELSSESPQLSAFFHKHQHDIFLALARQILNYHTLFPPQARLPLKTAMVCSNKTGGCCPYACEDRLCLLCAFYHCVAAWAG